MRSKKLLVYLVLQFIIMNLIYSQDVNAYEKNDFEEYENDLSIIRNYQNNFALNIPSTPSPTYKPEIKSVNQIEMIKNPTQPPIISEKQAFDNLLKDHYKKSIILKENSNIAIVFGNPKRIDQKDEAVTVIEKNYEAYVPLRFLCQNIGAKLIWDYQTQAVQIKYKNNVYKFFPNSSVVTNRSNTETLLKPGLQIDGRIYVHVQSFCSKVFNLNVLSENGLILISKDSINFKDKLVQQMIIERINTRYYVLETKIPILTYHHLQENIPSDLKAVAVTPLEFENQLNYILNSGYNPVNLSQVSEFLTNEIPLPQNPIVITMDDGYTSNYTLAYPILKKLSVKAVMFVVTSAVGETPGRLPHFSWEQAREMEKSGLVEIHSHGHYHLDFSSLNESQIIDGLVNSLNVLEKNLGRRKVNAFAYPGTFSSSISREVVQSLGFEIQMTGLGEPNTYFTNSNNLKRLSIEHAQSGEEIVELIRIYKDIK